MKLTDDELSRMIGDLSLSDEWPQRAQVCLALIELRDLRKRWHVFHWAFPLLAKWMKWLSRKP